MPEIKQYDGNLQSSSLLVDSTNVVPFSSFLTSFGSIRAYNVAPSSRNCKDIQCVRKGIHSVKTLRKPSQNRLITIVHRSNPPSSNGDRIGRWQRDRQKTISNYFRLLSTCSVRSPPKTKHSDRRIMYHFMIFAPHDSLSDSTGVITVSSQQSTRKKLSPMAVNRLQRFLNCLVKMPNLEGCNLGCPYSENIARIAKQLDAYIRYTKYTYHTSRYIAMVCVARAFADSSDFGLSRSKVHKNGRFPALDADKPPCKIWRR